MKKTKEEEQIYKDALSKYGDFAQLDQLVEEVGELLQALNKVKRKMPHGYRFVVKPNKSTSIDYSLAYYNACSEIADVRIMLKQMEYIFDKEAIDLAEERSLEELSNRLSNNE